MAVIQTFIQTAPFHPGRAWETLRGHDPDCGAIASFLGQVRGGEGLIALELEHYPGVTEKALERIAETAAARWTLSRAVIIHRAGRMLVGDPIVFVGATAPHRRDALDAVQYMIDVLKTQAPFWKKEETATGTRWIEPRDGDHAAAARWLAEESEEAS